MGLLPPSSRSRPSAIRFFSDDILVSASSWTSAIVTRICTAGFFGMEGMLALLSFTTVAGFTCVGVCATLGVGLSPGLVLRFLIEMLGQHCVRSFCVADKFQHG